MRCWHGYLSGAVEQCANDLHIVPLTPSATPSSPLKSRLIQPLRYRLTQVVLEKTKEAVERVYLPIIMGLLSYFVCILLLSCGL